MCFYEHFYTLYFERSIVLIRDTVLNLLDKLFVVNTKNGIIINFFV